MRKLKVYGITTICKPEHIDESKPWRVQCRYVAAVISRKELAELLGTTIGHVNELAYITANEKEVKLATANPHTIIFIEVR